MLRIRQTCMAAVMLGVLAAAGPATAQAPGHADAGTVVMSWPWLSLTNPATSRILDVDAQKNQIRIGGIPFQAGRSGPVEGYCVLLLRDGQQGPCTHVVPIEVTEILEDDSFLATFKPGAAEVLEGAHVDLVRPLKGNVRLGNGSAPPSMRIVATERLKALPAVLPLPGGEAQRQRALLATQLSGSVKNLKMIGLAMHNFVSTNGFFPPAVIHGPDGKPWHSWRVLMLPYLDQQPLYAQYDFRKPWDAPENRKVVETVVPVYQDPVHGEGQGPYTSYAVLVGPNAMFAPQAFQIRDLMNPLRGWESSSALTKIENITDGTAYTLCVVPVDPARKIRWAKPEDITVGPGFPGLGKAGGIALPYVPPDGGERLAPVALADGSVRYLDGSFPPIILEALMSPRGGEVVSNWRVRGFSEMTHLTIRQAQDGTYQAAIE